MEVEVGPVDVDSARAWLPFARSVVKQLDAGGALTDDVRAAFDGFLREWIRVAEKERVFRWTGEIDPEVLEYFVHAFHRLATAMNAEFERTGVRRSPPEGDAFYAALVRGLLDALGAASPATAEFAAHLRSFWPGIDPGTAI